MEHLAIKAGPIARKILIEKGLRPRDVRIMPSAASGPKWIVLYHLNRFLFSHWFPKDHPLDLIGASAGAWQMACAAQQDPGAAYDRFLKEYTEQTYPTMPTPEEVSVKIMGILTRILGENGIADILNNHSKNLSIVTNRSLFEVVPKKAFRQFFFVWLHNLISRKRINRFMERNVFSSQNQPPLDLERDFITTTQYHQLTSDNALAVIAASGSIPTVISPQVGLTGVGHQHWDGAVTDYHFGVPWQLDDGIILYSHYQKRIIPGWFDKHVSWRSFPKQWTDRLVMLHPTSSFVQALPNKTIPNRKDFKTYFQKDDIRIKNWYEAAEMGKGLLFDFKQYIGKPIPEELIGSF